MSPVDDTPILTLFVKKNIIRCIIVDIFRMIHEVKLMIDGYMNIKEASKRWGISTRRIQVLCGEGRIEGAAKLGRDWAIPMEAVKPSDNRITTGLYRGWRNSQTSRNNPTVQEDRHAEN